MADLFAHERVVRFELRIRELRARQSEPGIAPAVTPAELERRSLLQVVFGRPVVAP